MKGMYLSSEICDEYINQHNFDALTRVCKDTLLARKLCVEKAYFNTLNFKPIKLKILSQHGVWKPRSTHSPTVSHCLSRPSLGRGLLNVLLSK